jgi:hypothetical protein
MKKQKTKFYIVALLISAFAAPGVAAYLFYKNPSWLGSSRTNKGLLLTPAVELTSVKGQSKWRLIYWTPEACEARCLNQLDVLARVRLALGRKLYQVDQQLVLGVNGTVSSTLEQELNTHDVTAVQLSSADEQQVKSLVAEPQIFIMNPDNYLVLSYKSGVNPNDVYKDLKLLLNANETKKG